MSNIPQEYKVTQPAYLFSIRSFFLNSEPIFSRKNIKSKNNKSISKPRYNQFCQIVNPFKQTQCFQSLKVFIFILSVIFLVFFPPCLMMLGLFIVDYFEKQTMTNFYLTTLTTISMTFILVFIAGLHKIQKNIKRQMIQYCQRVSTNQNCILKPIFKKILGNIQVIQGYIFQTKN